MGSMLPYIAYMDPMGYMVMLRLHRSSMVFHGLPTSMFWFKRVSILIFVLCGAIKSSIIHMLGHSLEGNQTIETGNGMFLCH